MSDELRGQVGEEGITSIYRKDDTYGKPNESSKKPLCLIHDEALVGSRGWYGDKWECASCLREGFPQRDLSSFLERFPIFKKEAKRF